MPGPRPAHEYVIRVGCLLILAALLEDSNGVTRHRLQPAVPPLRFLASTPSRLTSREPRVVSWQHSRERPAADVAASHGNFYKSFVNYQLAFEDLYTA